MESTVHLNIILSFYNIICSLPEARNCHRVLEYMAPNGCTLSNSIDLLNYTTSAACDKPALLVCC